ncbi:hypothetical protein ACIO6U_03725 [Streptomyces sp. NPDC087422]|uniref:hypothetical protein n=1 Tax=Streptomyces sp. NPDC087422 TaxID=3365786 RepID=UPI0037F5568C
MTAVPPLALPHYNAIRAALAPLADRATGPIAVGDGGAPDPIPENRLYVALYVSPGRATVASLADDRTGLVLAVQVTSVGPTPERALWVADRVREVLAVRLTVAGRGTWRTEEQGGPPVQRDDGVTPPLYFVPVQYRLTSIPA